MQNLDLEQLAEYAALFLTVAEIAILLEIDHDWLTMELHNKESEVYKTYFKAKSKAVLDLRREEMQLARLGSPIAIDILSKALVNQTISENG